MIYCRAPLREGKVWCSAHEGRTNNPDCNQVVVNVGMIEDLRQGYPYIHERGIEGGIICLLTPMSNQVKSCRVR